MFKLAKAFYREFFDGPSFDNCIHHRLILEDKLLTFDVTHNLAPSHFLEPSSYLITQSKPAPTSASSEF